MSEPNTNGYSTDRKVIEYRLDQTDEKLGHIEAAIVGLAGDIRELKTQARSWGKIWGLIAGATSSIIVGVVIWLLTRS